jgi:hypothetical protein
MPPRRPYKKRVPAYATEFAHRQQMEDRRMSLRASRLCEDCGKVPPEKKLHRCRACLNKRKAQVTAARFKKSPLARMLEEHPITPCAACRAELTPKTVCQFGASAWQFHCWLCRDCAEIITRARASRRILCGIARVMIGCTDLIETRPLAEPTSQGAKEPT